MVDEQLFVFVMGCFLMPSGPRWPLLLGWSSGGLMLFSMSLMFALSLCRGISSGFKGLIASNYTLRGSSGEEFFFSFGYSLRAILATFSFG